MIRSFSFGLALLAGATAVLPIAVLAQQPASNAHAPVYTADGKLVPPTDYREWVYLSTGLDMSYNPKATASADPVFDNVFVNPEAYRVFRQTGTWPDKTQFALEVRSSASKGSINQRGHYQSDKVVGLEIHVKDTARFDGGWAFFDIDGDKPAERIPVDKACYACHQAHGAVDTTFVQFYPTLLPIARAHATLSAAYVQDEAQRLQAAH